MKHALLILVILFSGYVFWEISDKSERGKASKLITRHGLRLGVIILVVMLLLLAATYFPATSIV